jgi:hypothetical protein
LEQGIEYFQQQLQRSTWSSTIHGNGWKFATMVEIEEIPSIAAIAAISSKLAKLTKKEILTKIAKMAKLSFTYCLYMIKIS